MSNNKYMITFGGLLFIQGIIVIAIASFSYMDYEIKCVGHLKRAGNASTIELAKTEVQEALEWAQENRCTKGSTAWVWPGPREDIGFWYKNLSSSLEEMEKVTSETSQLEKTNILMKLRETLLDQTKEGVEVTVPPDLWLYPHQVLYGTALCISIIFGAIGAIMLFVGIFK